MTQSGTTMNERGRVVVRGQNIMCPPLLESNDVNLIEFYDSHNELTAFFVRIFTDDTWGLCTKNDPDWAEMCVRYGFSKVNGPADRIIREGVRPFIQG